MTTLNQLATRCRDLGVRSLSIECGPDHWTVSTSHLGTGYRVTAGTLEEAGTAVLDEVAKKVRKL